MKHTLSTPLNLLRRTPPPPSWAPTLLPPTRWCSGMWARGPSGTACSSSTRRWGRGSARRVRALRKRRRICACFRGRGRDVFTHVCLCVYTSLPMLLSLAFLCLCLPRFDPIQPPYTPTHVSPYIYPYGRQPRRLLPNGGAGGRQPLRVPPRVLCPVSRAAGPGAVRDGGEVGVRDYNDAGEGGWMLGGTAFTALRRVERGTVNANDVCVKVYGVWNGRRTMTMRLLITP